MPTTTTNGYVVPSAGTEPADMYGGLTRLGSSADSIATNYFIPTTWTNVTYNGSWTDYGSGFEETSYSKTGQRVYLRGSSKHATTGTTGTVFTLPAGYRPTKSRAYRCPAGNSGYADVNITSAGVVSIIAYTQSGNAGYLSFDSVSFDTAA